MGVYIWSRLPSEYQEVEYIESSGSQYINTGKTVSGNCKIDYTYMPKSSDTSVGYLIFMDNDRRSNGFGSGNTYLYYGGYTSNNEGYTVGSLQQNVLCHDIVSKSGCSRTINGNTVSYVPQSSYPSPTGNLLLFALQRAGSIISYFTTRMYSFKRYDSGVLTQDLIPCYRKSDSVIGLYDLVNNQFYTNSGSGTFTKGSDVDTYRESLLKNAYIGEVWTPTSNTLAYFPMQGDNLDKVGTFTLDVSGTQQTIGRKFTSQTSLNTTPTGIKTMSGWVKIASATPSGGSSGQCGILASYGNYLCYFNSSSNVKAKSIYCYANNTDYYKNVNIIDNSWHHIAITNNGSTIVGYVDGVSYALGNPSLPGLSKLLVFCSGGNTIDVTLSEVILENKQWTQSEVAHYFDITKANYGL